MRLIIVHTIGSYSNAATFLSIPLPTHNSSALPRQLPYVPRLRSPSNYLLHYPRMKADGIEVDGAEDLPGYLTSGSVITHTVDRLYSRKLEAENVGSHRSYAHVALEYSGIVLLLGWSSWIATSILERLLSNDMTLITTCGIWVTMLLGVTAADFVSGFIHWAIDNWGESDTPVLGPIFFYHFHFHHAHPSAIAMDGFAETNGNAALTSLPFVWIAASSLPRCLPACFWLSFAVSSGFANQTHAWAHMNKPPKLAQLLQNLGLVIGRRQHQIHHIRPHDRNYCILTGWMNGPLTSVRFFEAIESIIVRLTGATPLHVRH